MADEGCHHFGETWIGGAAEAVDHRPRDVRGRSSLRRCDLAQVDANFPRGGPKVEPKHRYQVCAAAMLCLFES